jgi:flagellar hook-basal body complex protein FliE
MIDSVSRLNGLTQLTGIQPAEKKTVGTNFSDMLMKEIEKVNAQQIDSDKMTEALATGKAPDIHTVMITAEKATISLQLATTIRNKAMEAYQEIMRMQM